VTRHGRRDRLHARVVARGRRRCNPRASRVRPKSPGLLTPAPVRAVHHLHG
jgi:hypothetical protein